MSKSVEVRSPFLDLSLVKYVLNEKMSNLIDEKRNETKIPIRTLATNKVGDFFKIKKEGTRNYSKYISNQKFWNLKKFSLNKIIDLNKKKLFNWREMHRLICLEILYNECFLNKKFNKKNILNKSVKSSI